MGPLTGVKCQSIWASLLKPGMMLGRLEYMEGIRELCLGTDCVDCV